jgi:hypothetical protein
VNQGRKVIIIKCVMIRWSRGDDQILVNIELVQHLLLVIAPQVNPPIQLDPHDRALRTMDHLHQHEAMEIDRPANESVQCKSMI